MPTEPTPQPGAGQERLPVRRSRRCTGVRLGEGKRDLIVAMLQAGYSKTKVAKELQISRHSVIAVARDTESRPACVSPKQAALVRQFKEKAKEELERVVLENLEEMTPKKARRASLVANITAVDKAMHQIEALEGNGANRFTSFWLQQNFGFVPSHAVSEATVPTIDVSPSTGQGQAADLDGGHRPVA